MSMNNRWRIVAKVRGPVVVVPKDRIAAALAEYMAAHPADDALSGTSENAVQNKVIKAALDEKVDSSSVHNIPAGGAAGQVLKKRSGTDYDAEWAEESGGGGGGSVTVDNSLSSTSENPVQNKVVYRAIKDLHVIATVIYNESTSAEIEAAYQTGKPVCCKMTEDGKDYFLRLVSRASATHHTFSIISAEASVIVWCINDIWGGAPFNIPSAAATYPANLGTVAAVGFSDYYARADHVHRMPSASDVGAISAPVSGGNNGQVLTKTSSGAEWSDAGTPTQAQTDSAVADWLDAHPEATTTVQDGSITEQKLDPYLKAKVNGGGISNGVKTALLALLEKVAYVDEDGQTYLDALEDALYPPANLVSITAVFDPGGTVIYDTNTLEDLKQYLTVTAHMDNGTTQPVTSYTLSGTLTEGTSTITVSYGGKTDSFVVAVSGQAISDETKWTSGVPFTYTPVGSSYVETNGTITEYGNWARTPYLPCRGASHLVFTAMASSTILGMNTQYNCFYDSNREFVSSFDAGPGTTEGGTKSVPVPENAAFFICSGKNGVYNQVQHVGGSPLIQITPFDGSDE